MLFFSILTSNWVFFAPKMLQLMHVDSKLHKSKIAKVDPCNYFQETKFYCSTNIRGTISRPLDLSSKHENGFSIANSSYDLSFYVWESRRNKSWKKSTFVDKYSTGEIKCKDDTSKVLLLKKCTLVNFVGVRLFSPAACDEESRSWWIVY